MLDAGCGSGAQCEWLADHGADVIGIDLSPKMVAQAQQRCGERVRLMVADLGEPLPLEPGSLDGVTCSLALHYLEGWSVPLASFAGALRPGGWAVISLDDPCAAALPTQRGGYFEHELVSDTWTKADVTVTQRFWRRPLGSGRTRLDHPVDREARGSKGLHDRACHGIPPTIGHDRDR